MLRALAAILLVLVLALAGCAVPDNRASGQAPGAPTGTTTGPAPGSPSGASPTPGSGTGATPGPAPGSDATPPPHSDWAMGPHDLRGSRAALEQDALTATNVGELGLAWSFQTDGSVTGTPTVMDGVVYAATWRGHVYALDAATGKQLWRHDSDAQIDAPVTPWQDLVLYGDAHGALTALNRSTGQQAWRVVPDPTNDTHIYATPVVHNGVVLLGIASDQESSRLHGTRPLDFRGSVAAIDARTGDVKWRTVLVEEGHTGAPVWSTPIVADELGLAIFGTGNAYTKPADAHTDSVIALRLADGSVAWSFQGTENDYFTQSNAVNPDWDFGSTGSLFHDANGKLLFGIGQKSTRFWALDAATGTPVWHHGDPVPGQGIIAATATAKGIVISAQTNQKRIDAFNATSGAVLWSANAEGMVFSAPAIVPGAVLVGDSTGKLVAYDLATGKKLWNASTGAAGGIFGGLSVANGMLFVPTVETAFLGDHGDVLAYAPGGHATVGSGGGAGAGSTDPHRVSLLNVAFKPDRLMVPPGTKVTWVNDDAIYHTATSGWDKGATFDNALQPGASASYVFDEPGTYVVYCKPHASPDGSGWAGMTMTVVVDPSAPT